MKFANEGGKLMNISVHKREAGEAMGLPGPLVGVKAPAPPVIEYWRFSSAGLDSELVTGMDAVLALETEWRELEEECGDTVLFQSFDWCANWIEMQRESGGKDVPAVAVWRCSGRIAGLLPLKVSRVKRLKVLTGLAEPFQQYTDMLALKGMAPERFAATFEKLVRTSGADFLHLGQVRLDSMLARVIHGITHPVGEVDHSPYVPISNWPDFETYHKTVKSKTRKNMRNSINRLERTGEVEHEAASSGQLVREVVQRTFVGRQDWLDRNGITSRAFQDDDFRRFVGRFAQGKVKGVEVLAMSLVHDGKPIADQWGFVYKGRYYAFMSAMDPEYEPVGPGKLHLGEVIKTCFSRKLKVVDFMIPSVPYKMTWTENQATVTDFSMPVSLRGRLYCEFWLATLRPLAKQLWMHLPVGLRNLLARKVF